MTFLLDFDGTIVDSMPYYCETMLKLLERRGIPAPEGLMRIITPLGYSGTADYFRDELGLREEKETLLQEMRAYALPFYRDVIPLKNGVREFLERTHSRGISLNILTASPHCTMDPCLERNGVKRLFDHIWSCEDFGTTKSDPAIYRAVAERLGKPPEGILFVDDNINACLTAKRAGVRAVGIYDKSSEGDRERFLKETDGYCLSFAEMTE